MQNTFLTFRAYQPKIELKIVNYTWQKEIKIKIKNPIFSNARSNLNGWLSDVLLKV